MQLPLKLEDCIGHYFSTEGVKLSSQFQKRRKKKRKKLEKEKKKGNLECE